MNTDQAVAVVAVATPALPNHRTETRPKPTKNNPAGWRWLTPTDLETSLKLKSDEIVEEIHGLSLRLLQSEDQREGRIDAKAQGLLITAGLSLTAASTFGGALLQHPDYFESLGSLGGIPSEFTARARGRRDQHRPRLAAYRFVYSTQPTFAQIDATGSVVPGPTAALILKEEPSSAERLGFFTSPWPSRVR